MKKATRLVITLLAVAAAGVAIWLLTRDEVAPARRTKLACDDAPERADAREPRRRGEVAESAPSVVVAGDASEADPKTTKRVLRILDERDEPVPGVLVRGPRAKTRTDARGEVSFEASDSATTVRFDDRDAERAVELNVPLTEARIDRSTMVAVDALDGLTGAAIAGVKWRMRVDRGEWIDGGVSPRLVVGRGRCVPFDVVVDAPDGFGAFSPFGWRAEVAGRTRLARIMVAVFPLHTVRLRAVDGEGRPVEGATMFEAVEYAPFGHSASWRPARTSKSDREGLLVIAMPRLPYGRVTVRVEREDEEGRLRGETDHVRLDDSDDAPPTKVVLFPYTGKVGVAADPRARVQPNGPTASLVVHVAYRDGSPASNIGVWAGPIDGATGVDGSVELREVPVGRCDVVARAHGFLPTVVAADVGHVEEVSIREAAPRTVRLQVVDESGAPRPGAMVFVRCVRVPGVVAEEVKVSCSVAQLEGEEERLSPTTVRDGTIELVATAGTMAYRATLGDAEGKTESSADFVKIVLVPPKD